MGWVSEKSEYKIPFTTINGTHDNRIVDNPTGTADDEINWWTNGFLGRHGNVLLFMLKLLVIILLIMEMKEQQCLPFTLNIMNPD